MKLGVRTWRNYCLATTTITVPAQLRLWENGKCVEIFCQWQTIPKPSSLTSWPLGIPKFGVYTPNVMNLGFNLFIFVFSTYLIPSCWYSAPLFHRPICVITGIGLLLVLSCSSSPTFMQLRVVYRVYRSSESQGSWWSCCATAAEDKILVEAGWLWQMASGYLRITYGLMVANGHANRHPIMLIQRESPHHKTSTSNSVRLQTASMGVRHICSIYFHPFLFSLYGTTIHE